jgi:Type II secretion system (T2SS), protein M subtype b
MGKLSPQGQRGLLVLLAATLCMLSIAIAPFFWNAGIERELDESRSELVFLKQKLATSKAPRKVSLGESDDIDAMYFAGETEGLAQSAFQSVVSSMATANKLQVERTQPLQSDRRDTLLILKLDIVARGTTENVRNFTLALEQAQPFIFVRSSNIAPDNEPVDPASPLLNFTMRLEAHSKAPVTQ